MVTNHLSNKVKQIVRSVKNLLLCTLAISATWLGIALTMTPQASAASLELHPQFLATDVIKQMDRKAKSDLDTVVGSGTSDKLEGQVDKVTGKIQQELGNARGQAEGAAKQVRGKAKEDIGTTKRTVEKAADKVEETTDNAVDSIKGFFNR